MKQSTLFYRVFPFIIMAVPWAYLAFIWKELPANIPTHFGINGNPDKFGAKIEIFIAPAILTAVGIMMYFILRNIYRIDPKKKYTAINSAVLSKLSIVIIILLCAVTLSITYWTVKGKAEGLPLLFCGLSLLLAYIGNLMHSIKPNYFAGIRVPWTLENEENWRKTHQLASKIWFIGGLCLALVSLLFKFEVMLIVFIASILFMTLIPIIYSYRLYKQSANTSAEN